ncbi:MAG: RNA pseudouridine synthase [Lentimicrobiaceae bacterium]|nr:RNA pseudouridine synthase [Lentimicrobiaceae bacterium]
MRQPIEERILFEDNHLIIVNKLPSEIVQGDKTGDVCLLDDVKSYIKDKYNKPGNVYAGLVHRIDRPVSGAVIFAKTSKALSRMTVKVKERQFSKTYLAIVKNKPPKDADELSHYMVKNESQNKSYIVSSSAKGAKLAQLRYRVIGASDSYYLLEIELITGRHHQIRAQLAHIGCPIKGDLKYGFPRSNPDASISLHAYRLKFEHPTTKTPIIVTAPKPVGSPWNFFN